MPSSVVLNLMPQFIIASMLSVYYFYWVSDVKYPAILGLPVVSRAPTAVPDTGTDDVKFSPLHPEKFSEDAVKVEMTRAINSVSIWIVILLVLSPAETFFVLVGSIPANIEHIVFPCLAAVFAVSLFSSAVDKIGTDKNRKIAALAVATVISILSFYFPSILWVTRMRTIMVILVMYLAALGIFGIGYFLMWKIKRNNLIRTGFFSSVAMYGTLISLFSYQLILHIL